MFRMIELELHPEQHKDTFGIHLKAMVVKNEYDIN